MESLGWVNNEYDEQRLLAISAAEACGCPMCMEWAESYQCSYLSREETAGIMEPTESDTDGEEVNKGKDPWNVDNGATIVVVPTGDPAIVPRAEGEPVEYAGLHGSTGSARVEKCLVVVATQQHVVAQVSIRRLCEELLGWGRAEWRQRGQREQRWQEGRMKGKHH